MKYEVHPTLTSYFTLQPFLFFNFSRFSRSLVEPGNDNREVIPPVVQNNSSSRIIFHLGFFQIMQPHLK